MENREEQELGLSPWRSATTSDEFWDRGLEENKEDKPHPQITI
jgi:hypothetical protein